MTKQDNLRHLLNAHGRITIAALDHRGSLKEQLHPDSPDATTDNEILAWKRRMVDLYKDEASGILIDPLYGKTLVSPTTQCGWMLSMEKTGYRGGKAARETEILPDWSVRQAKEMGAHGVKLLLYYNPTNRVLADTQKKIAARVAADCQKEGIVFLLEPLSYDVPDSDKPSIVTQTARELAGLPVDIFKFEYPGTAEACQELTKIVPSPWVLLSAGMVYDHYSHALKIAMQSGASGFAVGRAVWQEFGTYTGDAREQYFVDVALPRMRELIQIVNTV